MDFLGVTDGIIPIAESHTGIIIALALGLLFFIYRRPKLFFTLLFVGLFLAGSYYMITSMARSGSEQKERLIQEEEKRSDNIP